MHGKRYKQLLKLTREILDYPEIILTQDMGR